MGNLGCPDRPWFLFDHDRYWRAIGGCGIEDESLDRTSGFRRYYLAQLPGS